MTTPLKRLLTGSSALNPPVLRDPVSAAIATAITGATSGFAFTAVQILAGIGVSMVVNYALSALAPKQGMKSAGAQGLLVNVRDPAAPREYVYGKIRKGGTITYYESTNDNKFLHMILVLAAHEVAAIDDIYIDDKLVTINGSNFVTSHGWNSKIRIKKYLGTAGQTADPDLVAESAKVDSNFRGRGIAYLYIRLEYDPDVFTNGIPLFTAIVRGKPVFDPRTSTTGYSANWALCVRDYLLASYGLEDSASNVDNTYINVAANLSDELINTPNGQVPRYEMNAVINSDEKVGDVLKKMMTAGAGTLFWGQGKWRLKGGAYTPSVRSIGLSDLRSAMSIQPRQSTRDNFNIVRGTFYNERKRYIEMDYPEVRSATFIAQDNNREKPFDYELPYTTNATRCSKLARILLLRSREQITFAADFGMSMFGVEVGDTISFTNSRYGWTNKEFEVVSWKYNANTNGELVISVMLREISSAVYSGNVADEQEIIANDSNLPDPNAGLVISGLAQTSTSTVESDGRLICSSFVSWNAISSTYLRDFQVQWKLNSRTDWNSTTTVNNSIELTGLAEGKLHNLRVRARSTQGNHGPWATLDFTPTGDVSAPTMPTLVQVIPGYDSLIVDWENPANADFRHVEVYVNTANDSAGSSLLGKTDGSQFIHPNLAIGVTRWYFLKSVDFTGNKSAFTTGVSGTTTGVPTVDLIGDIVADQVADGAINTAKFAAGIAPVEIVSTLPTTGNFEGRTVYLTTDNKLYRYDGTAFIASVPTTDLTGQVTTTQITDNAITTAKVAAGAITASDIAADTITAGQIAAGAISASEIAADAVTTDKIAADAVTANEVAANAIAAGSIQTDAITSAKIAANAITSAKIAADAITAGKIAAGAIDTTNLIVDGAVSRRFYARDNTGTAIGTTLVSMVSKTGMGGLFNAFQGTAGNRSNPIMVNVAVEFNITASFTAWRKLILEGDLLVSGVWTNWLSQDVWIPPDLTGIWPYNAPFVADTGNWSGATGFRLRVAKAVSGGHTVSCGATSFLVTQISV